MQRKWAKTATEAVGLGPVPAPAAALYAPELPTGDTAEEMEQTWQQRLMDDERIRAAYTSSKLLSRTKQRLKAEAAAEREAREREEMELMEQQEEEVEEPQGRL